MKARCALFEHIYYNIIGRAGGNSLEVLASAVYSASASCIASININEDHLPVILTLNGNARPGQKWSLVGHFGFSCGEDDRGCTLLNTFKQSSFYENFISLEEAVRDIET
jgi:hypothetical protein